MRRLALENFRFPYCFYRSAPALLWASGGGSEWEARRDTWHRAAQTEITEEWKREE